MVGEGRSRANANASGWAREREGNGVILWDLVCLWFCGDLQMEYQVQLWKSELQVPLGALWGGAGAGAGAVGGSVQGLSLQRQQ